MKCWDSGCNLAPNELHGVCSYVSIFWSVIFDHSFHIDWPIFQVSCVRISFRFQLPAPPWWSRFVYSIMKFCKKKIQLCFLVYFLISCKILPFMQIVDRNWLHLISREKLHRIHIKPHPNVEWKKRVLVTHPIWRSFSVPSFWTVKKNFKKPMSEIESDLSLVWCSTPIPFSAEKWIALYLAPPYFCGVIILW